MFATARNGEVRRAWRSLEPPAHPTATFALFEHCFAGAFDDPGSDREPRSPIAGVIGAIVMKREIGLFVFHDILGRHR